MQQTSTKNISDPLGIVQEVEHSTKSFMYKSESVLENKTQNYQWP